VRFVLLNFQFSVQCFEGHCLSFIFLPLYYCPSDYISIDSNVLSIFMFFSIFSHVIYRRKKFLYSTKIEVCMSSICLRILVFYPGCAGNDRSPHNHRR
jgi:hypothetical protein